MNCNITDGGAQPRASRTGKLFAFETLALLFFLSLLLCRPQVYAQKLVPGLDTKVTVDLKDETIDRALQIVGAKAGVSFVYSNKLLHTDRKVTRQYRQTTVFEILRDLLGEDARGARQDGDQIFIRPVPKRKANSGIGGKVTSAAGEPVIGATVFVAETGSGTTAGVDGQYEITGLEAGTYSVTVSSVGYFKFNRVVVVKSDKRAVADFVLKEDQQQLGEVKVVGATETRAVKESGFNVNAIEVKQFNNTTKDVNQVLNMTPGVRIREQGGLGSDFSFSINGLSGKAVRFFIDGIPMENFGIGMQLNNIPVNLADRLEVYKGSVPVELGSDALGGGVNVITSKGTRNHLDASYSLGSFNTHRAALNSQLVDAKRGMMFRLNGFFNYSENNYLMRSNPEYNAEIRVPDGAGGFQERNVRRFHDDYRSYMIQGEWGFVNKSWADVLMVGLLYNNHYRQFQTGATQAIVYGKVDRRGDFLMPSIRYKKENFLTQGLSVSAYASYGIDNYAVADTSTSTYWWDGSIAATDPSRGEFASGTPRSLTEYKNRFLLLRGNVEYKVGANHKLIANYNWSRAERDSYEELKQYTATPATLSKQLLGVAWKSEYFENRLTNTLFAKFFKFGMLLGVQQTQENGNFVFKSADKNYNKFGYGLASRFKLASRSGVRFSYEHSYRLPEQIEVLGDGVTVVANYDIRPESSHNFNLGTDHAFAVGKSRFQTDLSVFYRNAKDFIYSIPWSNNASRYLNEGKVRVYGAEVEAAYKYSQLLEVGMNATYQKSTQNQKYIYGTGTPYATYGNTIPNQPWFFANLLASIGKNGLLGEGSRIQADWSSQYVHWFFLTWEAWGSKQSRNKVPAQLTHNLGITCSFKNGRYNLTAESRNLTDQLVYDSFRLQKPGRSFNVKLRYFIH